ncbi:MAG: protein-disulfide reductase DsbD family protein [Candidatus Cryptobacteroides sp.]
MKRFLLTLTTLLCAALCFAQQSIVSWSYDVQPADDNIVKVVFTGKIAIGYHTYTLADDLAPTEVFDVVLEGAEEASKLYESLESRLIEGHQAYEGKIQLVQELKLTSGKGSYSGTIYTSSCKQGQCRSEYYDFNIELSAPEAVAAPMQTIQNQGDSTQASSGADSGNSIWSLILEAILWGFAMLLTPCVFPMVPMTVSFFMKGSGTPAQGRFKASMYGLFIVLLYTVPISVIILLTRLIGGDAVTADIFNWLATHWLPNIIFFLVFMAFAASFFGAFEITLPSKWTNAADKNSDKKGLGGIFFLALTLVLVSFSCTGPIVGTVLIKSTQGEFWAPMVTMLAFSVAFALPFTLLAFFPSLLKKFKKSGGNWLSSVKVVLGFIEVALGLKFLSTADQTYHWGILDREVYLAIWIVVFSLMGFYLLGKIRFKDEEKVEHIGVTRLALAIGVFSFVVYLIPGMWGAPLKALSGYLPPITTQDFVLSGGAAPTATLTPSQSAESSSANRYGLELPLGLSGYFTLDEGLEAAKKAGKPLFVDVTGHGCVNCREMEARVWSDPRVLKILSEDYVIVALYNDDKQKLDEKDYVTDAQSGKVYKDLGRANSYLARTLWGVNAQPNYILLSPEGEQLVPVRGYDLSVDGFIAFLQSGLDAFRSR